MELTILQISDINKINMNCSPLFTNSFLFTIQIENHIPYKYKETTIVY